MVIAIVGLISLLALYPLKYFEFSNTLENWFPASKEYLEKYNDFLDHFGCDAYIIIIYRDYDLFSRQEIKLNRDLTSRLHAQIASPSLTHYNLLYKQEALKKKGMTLGLRRTTTRQVINNIS